MTEAIYIEVKHIVDELNGKRHVSVSGMLHYLGVSRAGYNAWRVRQPSKQEQRKFLIVDKIQDIYDESHQNYGAPKITQKLITNGETISERTVGIYMRELGIKAQYVKPYTITTRDSNFSNQLVNILDEKFNPERPNAVWCTDITYIWTFNGFVYLTSIMDLYARKIIAWTLSKTLEVKYVIDTINKAKASRKTSQPLIIHSDRGSQFVAEEYRTATKKMQTSYSKKAYPWDNACIESFHSLIKREWLNRFRIIDYEHAHKLVFEYMETFYNTVRIHSYCGYKSPNQYEKEYHLQATCYV